MLDTQKYLRSGGTLDDLAEQFNIDSRRHSRHPLVVLNYNNDSPKFDKRVRECRGLVLEEDTWEVVGKPMTRFYNYGEHPEETANFDWSNFRTHEKIDGTFVLLSPYKGEWILSTRGTFGDHQANNSGYTWEQLFWQTVPHLSPGLFSPDTCYGFELWTPFNAVITRYPGPAVWLLYVYSLDQEEEWPDFVHEDMARQLRVMTPQVSRFFNSIGHIKGFLGDISREEPDFEGVVLKDCNGIRIKCKTDTYLELHKFYGNGSLYSPKRLVPLWLSGDFGEVLKRFPDVETPLREIGVKLDEECSKLYKLWMESKSIQDQKEFAQYILPRTELSGILFDIRKRYQLNPDDVTFVIFREAWSQWGDLLLKKLWKNQEATA